MRTINIHEAKTHLSRLIEEVMGGMEIIIAKAGKPVVKLVPLNKTLKKRKLGILAGKLCVSDQFDAPLPDEIIRQFEGHS